MERSTTWTVGLATLSGAVLVRWWTKRYVLVQRCHTHPAFPNAPKMLIAPIQRHSKTQPWAALLLGSTSDLRRTMSLRPGGPGSAAVPQFSLAPWLLNKASPTYPHHPGSSIPAVRTPHVTRPMVLGRTDHVYVYM